MPEYIDEILEKVSEDVLKRLKGEKGDSPSKQEVLELVVKVFEANKESLKGEPGKAGKPGKDAPLVNENKIITEVVSKIPKPKNGEPGKPGEPGDKGEPGKTPNHEIDSYKLRFENPDGTWGEWIDFEKLIKDVAKTLRPQVIEKTKRLGGGISGGLGKWFHEEFDTDSSTTSVSVERMIAGRGTVAFVRYNGQMLAHNVHYTVNARDITFTFTLDDNSNVDVSYVGI